MPVEGFCCIFICWVVGGVLVLDLLVLCACPLGIWHCNNPAIDTMGFQFTHVSTRVCLSVCVSVWGSWQHKNGSHLLTARISMRAPTVCFWFLLRIWNAINHFAIIRRKMMYKWYFNQYKICFIFYVLSAKYNDCLILNGTETSSANHFFQAVTNHSKIKEYCTWIANAFFK